MAGNKEVKEHITARDRALGSYEEFLRLTEYPQTPDDIENAVRCLKAAADGGISIACLEMGLRLGSGVLYEDETLGITIDSPIRSDQALGYFVRGAGAESSACIYQIAAAMRVRHPVFYDLGLDPDDDRYLSTLMAAASPQNSDKGSPDAMLELGLLVYNAGDLIWKGINKPEEDVELAYAIFREAAQADNDSQAVCLAGLLTAVRLLQEPSPCEDPNDSKAAADMYIAFAMRRRDCRDLAEEVMKGGFKTVKALADEISRRKDNASWPVRSFLRKED